MYSRSNPEGTNSPISQNLQSWGHLWLIDSIGPPHLTALIGNQMCTSEPLCSLLASRETGKESVSSCFELLFLTHGSVGM